MQLPKLSWSSMSAGLAQSRWEGVLAWLDQMQKTLVHPNSAQLCCSQIMAANAVGQTERGNGYLLTGLGELNKMHPRVKVCYAMIELPSNGVRAKHLFGCHAGTHIPRAPGGALGSDTHPRAQVILRYLPLYLQLLAWTVGRAKLLHELQYMHDLQPARTLCVYECLRFPKHACCLASAPCFLPGGWREFVQDHTLVTGDVVVFELINSTTVKTYFFRSAGRREGGRDGVQGLAYKPPGRHNGTLHWQHPDKTANRLY
jgi:hypothetical protein